MAACLLLTRGLFFTHGDLTNCNIIVDLANFELRALIDWEGEGYLPVWWEFMGASFRFGEGDLEWKRLLLGTRPIRKRLVHGFWNIGRLNYVRVIQKRD